VEASSSLEEVYLPGSDIMQWVIRWQKFRRKVLLPSSWLNLSNKPEVIYCCHMQCCGNFFWKETCYPDSACVSFREGMSFLEPFLDRSRAQARTCVYLVLYLKRCLAILEYFLPKFRKVFVLFTSESLKFCYLSSGASFWSWHTNVRFEVFTAVTMKSDVFWDVMPCGSCKNRRFGGT
jgi:hypothetical protein